jgi:hypothetical protein
MMTSNMAPKFGKVELLLKTDDSSLPSTINISFEDCGLMITGDYIIVIIDERDEIKDALTSTGKIFPLKDIAAYKTHSK